MIDGKGLTINMNFLFNEEKHEYTLDGVVLPSVTQVLKGVGLINSDWFTEEARHRGTEVHKMTQYYDEGDLDEATVPDEWKGYLEAWKKFKMDSGIEIKEIEKRMWTNVHRFAGTADRIAQRSKTGVILDIKSGAIGEWVRYQLAAYEMLYDSTSAQIRLAVQLKPDGAYSMKTFDDPNDFDDFLCILRTYNILKGNV